MPANPTLLADALPGFPIEDVRCGVCESARCLMYPDPGEDDGAPQEHRPSTVCPRCSTPTVEAYLRHAAEHKGFRLKPVSVFGVTRPVPVQRMQDLLDQGTAEQSARCKAALAESWEATDGGSDWTTDFERGEDGRLIYHDGGARPSYALALLFDLERHMREESTALSWGR